MIYDYENGDSHGEDNYEMIELVRQDGIMAVHKNALFDTIAIQIDKLIHTKSVLLSADEILCFTSQVLVQLWIWIKEILKCFKLDIKLYNIIITLIKFR